MSALVSLSAVRRRHSAPRQARLRLETLEDRSVPAALTLSAVVQGEQSTVVVSGDLTGTPDQANSPVYLSGAASGVAYTDLEGHFVAELQLSSLGELAAWAAGGSASASTEVQQDGEISITWFTWSDQGNNVYKLYGSASYSRPFTSLEVQIGGEIQTLLTPRTTTTDATGAFSMFVTLTGQPNDDGTIWAKAKSPLGKWSTALQEFITQS